MKMHFNPNKSKLNFSREMKLRHLSFLLTAAFAVLMALLLNAIPVQAAKTTLSQKTLEIGVADSRNISYWLINANSKASYTYASSNKKVAAVSKKGIVKSIKTGTAKITVKQTLNKKTTKVGTITVKVKNSRLSAYFFLSDIWWITNQPGYFKSTYNTDNAHCLMPDGRESIEYYNPKAVYTLFSSDESRISVDKKGYVKNSSGTGTVKMTVKETYNKKTRTVGTFSVELRTPSLTDENREQTIVIGELLKTGSFLSSGADYAVWKTETPEAPDINEINTSPDSSTDDDNVLASTYENGKWSEGYKGLGTGTRYLHYYMYDYTQQKFTTLLGTIKVNVIEVPDASSIQMAFEKEADYHDYNPADGLALGSLSCRSYDVFAEPYNYSGALEAVSSDESVVKAVFIKSTAFFSDYNRIGTLYLAALNPGTAAVTVKANGTQTSFKVTVASKTLAAYNDYEADTYFKYDGDVSVNDITFTSSDESIAEAKIYYVDNADDSSNPSDCKYLNFTITTKPLPSDASPAPVTITAYCKGTEIYSVTLNVSN